METLGDALPKEQARVREIMGIYQREAGPAGAFAIAMMEQALQRADEAVMSGDLVAMMQSYEELKDFSL